jgi:hypothetical protein
MIAGLVVVVGFEANLLFGSSAKNTSTFTAYARQILRACADAKYKPTCYDEEIPKLMEKFTMEDTFKITSFVQNMDESYGYCHVLGHKLSAAETSKDPSKWTEVISRCPSGVCSNGCIHGAFQERFRKESLTKEEIAEFKPQFSEVCEARNGYNPTGLEKGSCYHALGHLLMYITSADIPASLSLCRELAKKNDHDFTQVCYDGVFMQIYQPLEPDDFTLIEGKEVSKEEAPAFCARFSGKEKSSCWSESWPLFFDEILSPGGALKHCSVLSDDKDRCFDSLMFVVPTQMRFNIDDIIAYCKALPEAESKRCFSQTAARFIETDYKNSLKSARLCEAAAPVDKEGDCWKDLVKFSTFNFHKGSAEWKRFCEVMPSPWKETCLR